MTWLYASPIYLLAAYVLFQFVTVILCEVSDRAKAAERREWQERLHREGRL